MLCRSGQVKQKILCSTKSVFSLFLLWLFIVMHNFRIQDVHASETEISLSLTFFRLTRFCFFSIKLWWIILHFVAVCWTTIMSFRKSKSYIAILSLPVPFASLTALVDFCKNFHIYSRTLLYVHFILLSLFYVIIYNFSRNDNSYIHILIYS